MASFLTPQDVSRLLSEPSPDLRADLADKVATTLSGAELAPGEVALAQDIVRILAKDVEARVRATLSHGLRHSRTLPRDVALALADDIDAVALPLLTDSLVLTDDDLVEIVRNGTPGKHAAIAARPNLGETVSDAIITHAEAQAVVVLMGNRTATIAEASLDKAVTRFSEEDMVKQAMVLRHSLPLAVCERLITLVSKEFQEHLVKRHALSPSTAADVVLNSREHAILRLSMGSSDQELARMVAQMHHNGRLTPTLILRALCTGDIGFFEASMAVRGGVPLSNAQMLIHEPGRRGLVALYRKAQMPESLYDVVHTAVDVVDETGFDGNPRDLERFRARVISRLLTVVDTVDPADADYLIQKLGEVLVYASTPDGLEAPLVA